MSAFKFHHMTNVELMDIFGMADINKDGFLSIEEWKAFHRIFISEFELCIEGDYYALDIEGLECQLTQDWFKRIAYDGGIWQDTFESFGDFEEEAGAAKEKEAE